MSAACLACLHVGGAAPVAPAPGLWLDRVTCERAWDTTGVVPTGCGIRFTTDRGYVVELTTGSLVDHTLTLVTCDDPVMAPARPVGWLGVPGGLRLAGSQALAGHGTAPEVSTIDPVSSTDLLRVGPAQLGAVACPAARSCGVHWLIGGMGADLPSVRLVGHPTRRG